MSDRRSEQHLERTIGALIPALAIALCLGGTGCGSTEETVRTEPSLPFVVLVEPLTVTPGSDAEPALPLQQPQVDELHRKLAAAVRASGIFTRVLTKAREDLPEDMVLKLGLRGNDFGEGQVMPGGAAISTFVWLVGGHLSWVIDNRSYPDAKVQLDVTLDRAVDPDRRTPLGTKGRAFFKENLSLKGLQLSFHERANADEWFLNIIVPPWWGDGDAGVASDSLVDRATERFQAEVPARILSRLPLNFQAEQRSFLVHRPETREIFLISRDRVLEIELRKAGEVLRQLDPEESGLKLGPGTAERRSALTYISDERNLQLEVDRSDNVYALRLEPDEWGTVRVQARLDQRSPSTWTVDARPGPNSNRQAYSVDLAREGKDAPADFHQRATRASSKAAR